MFSSGSKRQTQFSLPDSRLNSVHDFSFTLDAGTMLTASGKKCHCNLPYILEIYKSTSLSVFNHKNKTTTPPKTPLDCQLTLICNFHFRFRYRGNVGQ